VPDFWHRSKKDKEQEPPSDEKKADERKLSGLKPMHIDPDDDQPTREDKEAGRKRSVPGVP
jgi:hypothetical protein